MNWNVFLHSLIAAAVGGAVTGLTTAMATGTDLKHASIAGGAGALVAVAGMLKQSPLTGP